MVARFLYILFVISKSRFVEVQWLYDISTVMNKVSRLILSYTRILWVANLIRLLQNILSLSNSFSVNFFSNLLFKTWRKCALHLCAMYIKEIGVSSQHNRIYTILVIYFRPIGLSYLNTAQKSSRMAIKLNNYICFVLPPVKHVI